MYFQHPKDYLNFERTIEMLDTMNMYIDNVWITLIFNIQLEIPKHIDNKSIDQLMTNLTCIAYLNGLLGEHGWMTSGNDHDATYNHFLL